MNDDALIDSHLAWRRLAAAMILMAIGGSGMYSMVVALPLVQADFGASRSDVSLVYSLTMIGFGVGGVLMGRLSDRYGPMVPVMGGSLCLSLGYIAAGASQNLLQLALAHGLMVGLLGASATFGPLISDAALWFRKHRGIAVSLCASGNYFAGALWPPVMQFFVDRVGWRGTFTGMGVFCLVMVPVSLMLRRRPPHTGTSAGTSAAASGSSVAAGAGAGEATTLSPDDPHARPLGFTPGVLLFLLCIAGVGCCVAMAMPQVHMIAYCGDLGYAAARGAEMISLMLGFGVVSRLISGWIADRIGGLRTLLLGAVLQSIALMLFLPFDGLAALYVVSMLFGLFQGGLVPAYALIIREYFPARGAAMRVGVVLMATLFGMALGGWLPGAIFDFSGSYRAAFANAVAWNALTIAIAAMLLYRAKRIDRPLRAVPAAV